ncbi:Do/DeqQ family serine protease [Methylohalomonas lacus]|uniref:Do/DeqQ family serine protease n=1 Tax=Methylohalomonas lacus TaxID=398773 RepID=A0AAE3L4U8_9GAMM|nr:trypsin-like peptidase domain-containing protein [Methylohalomonas lacus]MCS3902232.1 Do/DeqQ family serine protease [Methylohalomonas lacus]
MSVKKILLFVVQSALIGLIAAVLILIIRPELLDSADNHDGEKSATPATKAGNSSTQGPASYHAAVEKAAPAVVNVLATTITPVEHNPLLDDPQMRDFLGGELPEQPRAKRDDNYGSGVILNDQGYILTNNHLVSTADEIQVTLRDGRQANARVIGSDPDTDLAVLKVKLDNLPALTIADSTGLRIGDVVLAIGNPYGFGQTVTQGIVSATGRKRLGISTFEDFIQTDAAINPGNSGGALVNASGELIGINTAIISNTGGSQGIGLATPVHIATNVMKQLIENGRVTRGWLGIEAQIAPPGSIPEDIADNGVLIAGIMPGGPADQVGLQPGDIIISILDEPVTGPEETIRRITSIDPGTEISLEVLRGWDVMEFKPEVAERPSFDRG